MQERRLGKNGPAVSALGLGCMGMSFAYGPADEAESLRVLHRYLELGGNFLDTAEIYGPWKNEELVGKFLGEVPRGRVVVATKFGFRIDSDGTRRGLDSSPANIRRAVEGSLERLGIDVIDLYYQHRVDPSVPIEETVGAMARLIERGKVRYLGLSEAAPATVRRAHNTHPIAAVQSEYSLLYRQNAEETLATTRPLGISYIAYSPLGRSLLTGAVRKVSDIPEGDGRGRHPRFAGENLARNL